MFDELVQQIVKFLAEKPHVLVAISGFGDAGKSHLADKLCDYFRVKNTQIVRVDNLYGQNPDGPGIFDQNDWALLARILKDARAGKKLQYQGKDFTGKHLHFNEELPKVVIFEGVRLLQPELIPNFDISVWIDCPQDFGMQRAKDRDRKQGENEKTISRWDTEWGPQDREYFNQCHPEQLATFIYKEYK